jgi:hypothetical protein
MSESQRPLAERYPVLEAYLKSPENAASRIKGRSKDVLPPRILETAVAIKQFFATNGLGVDSSDDTQAAVGIAVRKAENDKLPDPHGRGGGFETTYRAEWEKLLKADDETGLIQYASVGDKAEGAEEADDDADPVDYDEIGRRHEKGRISLYSNYDESGAAEIAKKIEIALLAGADTVTFDSGIGAATGLDEELQKLAAEIAATVGKPVPEIVYKGAA